MRRCVMIMMAALSVAAIACATQPNIVLLITDDQGYGDLGCTGNPEVLTPNIDAFASQAVVFDRFFCSNVCTPTRASLMTGRYNHRTYSLDVGNGRSAINPEELTLAEILKANGYHTGIYGKWHLGDHYPSRAMDQGFDEALVHYTGKIFTTPEAGYFNPFLIRNGVKSQYPGYCMDIYTDYALQFMEKHAAEPFFIYLSTNTPHDPWDDVPQEFYDLYLGITDPDPETQETARIYYGMISNIDANFKRVLDKLDELGVADDTIVIYMSDNGQAAPGAARYTAGLRGGKNTPYENGIRVPFFMRWPNGIPEPKTIDTIAAHIDILPTLVSAAGIDPPAVALDGRDLMPLILEDSPVWPDRTLVLQTHRGDRPNRYQNAAIRTRQWKLVTNDDRTEEPDPIIPQYELYNMLTDIGETANVAAANPAVVTQLKNVYDAWFDDIAATTDFDNRSRIQIGTEFELRAEFGSSARYKQTGESSTADGRFVTDVVTPGLYRITLDYDDPAAGDLPVYFAGQGQYVEETMPSGATEHPFVVDLLPGPMDLRAWRDDGGFQLPATTIVELLAANDLEAETTAFTNGSVTADATASSGKFVAGGDGFTIRWTVPASAGDFGLVFSIKAPAGDGSMGVFLNDAQVGVLSSSATAWEKQTIAATLLEGDNIVELRDSEESAELNVDYMTLSFVVPGLPGTDSSGRLEAEDGFHDGRETLDASVSSGVYVGLGGGDSVTWNFDGGPGGGAAGFDISFRTAAINKLRSAELVVNGESIGEMFDSTKQWQTTSFTGVAIAPGINIVQVKQASGGTVNVDYMDYDFTALDGVDSIAQRATEPLVTFTDWAQAVGLPADFDGDEDGDGISNGAEFYFRGDPSTSFASTLTVGPNGGTPVLRYVYRRRARTAPGTVFRVEQTDSLLNPAWTEAAGTVINQDVAADDADYLNVTREIPANASNAFLRLVAEEPPSP